MQISDGVAVCLGRCANQRVMGWLCGWVGANQRVMGWTCGWRGVQISDGVDVWVGSVMSN